MAILQKDYFPTKYTIDAERCTGSGLRKFLERKELGKKHGIAKYYLRGSLNIAFESRCA